MDKTALVNYALSKLGEDPILALTDDTKRARLANRTFDQIRDAELRRVRWKFSIARTTLVALDAAPTWGYSRQFPLPADFIALVQVNDIYVRAAGRQRAPWSLEQGMILTDLPAPLKLRYVARITNSGLFDPMFDEVLAEKCALEWCETLTQSDTKLQARQRGYTFALSEAKRQDAIENPPDDIPWGSWLDAREGEQCWGAADGGDVTDFPSGVTVL